MVLREFTATDWQEVLNYQREPVYLRYYPWEERGTDDVVAFVEMIRGWQSENPRRRFQLAITLKGDERVVGSCGLRRKPENDWEADIGYELAPAHWGKGLATEAAQAMANFGWTELDLHRISSWCIADNAASARVLEKLGMRLEGRLVENEYFKGRWWDTLLYGTVRREEPEQWAK